MRDSLMWNSQKVEKEEKYRLSGIFMIFSFFEVFEELVLEKTLFKIDF